MSPALQFFLHSRLCLQLSPWQPSVFPLSAAAGVDPAPLGPSTPMFPFIMPSLGVQTTSVSLNVSLWHYHLCSQFLFVACDELVLVS